MSILKVPCAAAALILGPISQAAADEWTATPRAWLLFDDVVRPQGTDTTANGSMTAPDSGSATEAEPFSVVMYGGSVSYYSTSAKTSFTLTALAGTGSETISMIQFQHMPSLTTVLTEQETDFSRTDVEFTGQRQLSSGIGLMFGIRYENFEGSGLTVRHIISDDPTNNYLDLSDGTLSYDAYSARAGIAAASPRFFLDSKLYANLQIFVGQRLQHQKHTNQREVDRTTGAVVNTFGDTRFDREALYFGPDIAAGFLVPLGDSIDLDFRYRSLIYYDFDSDRPNVELDSPRTTHGLNVGVSVRF
jgi:opacity protein-like surface antigen